MKKWKLVAISVPLGIMLFFAIAYLAYMYAKDLEYEKLRQEAEELEMNSPSIEITGTVVYVVSTEGPNYQLIPEPSELSKFGETEITAVNLGGKYFALTSDLDGKKVMVKGVFIENPIGFPVQYSTVKPVVVVKELTVLG